MLAVSSLPFFRSFRYRCKVITEDITNILGIAYGIREYSWYAGSYSFLEI